MTQQDQNNHSDMRHGYLLNSTGRMVISKEQRPFFKFYNLVFVSSERKCLQCKLRRVLDHYFNVPVRLSRPRNGTRPNLVLNSTGRGQQAVKDVFTYFLFLLHGGGVYLLLTTSGGR